MSKNNKNQKQNIEKAEDVEFSYELADSEDMEAVQRMKAADRRAQNKNK
nr:YfhD family protein [Aquibacillus sediminis]